MLETLATICEILMVICFGASWPFNIIKAYKSKSTKGTSLQFMSLIDFGYVCGMANKMMTLADKGSLTWLQWVAFAFYIVNFALVTTGIVIYFRNKKLESAEATNDKN